MPLAEYRRKRDFQKTREPRGTPASGRGRAFVVQKHDASHLHYDFRLELDGELKSWAVPKGPSLDPAEKRLAVAVEDHPLEYGSFEGTIPEGQYGGGTVMLWDRGDWEPVGDAAAGYRAGKLKFRLHGEKLNGGWTLVRAGGQGRDPRQWLLIKERDEEARDHEKFDVAAREPLSVASGRDLDEIASAGDAVWDSTDHKASHRKSSRARPKSKASSVGVKPPARSRVAKTAGKSKAARGSTKLPTAIKPQLATLVDKPPEGPEWIHEFKFDGYRVVAFVDRGDVRLQTRGGLDWTAKFPTVAAACGQLKLDNAVLDGEVVALNEQGVSDFQNLQQALHQGSGSLIYYVFDLLWLNGDDLRPLPLAERKARLKSLKLPSNRGAIRLTEHIAGHGDAFFAEAARLGLEGMVSKRADRPYQAGRGPDWLKIKCAANSEFVIGGFTQPVGSRVGFGALLLGYYDAAGDLQYAGRVGTGFDDQLLGQLSKKLHRLELKKSPFAAAKIKRERGAHWVRPTLVAQVRYSNWTRDGLLRHPAFLGLREDKPARNVHREQPAPVAQVERKSHSQSANANGAARKTSSPKSVSPKSVPAKAAEAAAVAWQRLTHPDRVLYPDEQITKRDLADYYLAAAPWMLPHVADRPLSIVRCPAGLSGPRFFQKHPTPGMLERLARVSVKEKAGTGEYVVIREAADLVELVQFGALELHVWGSRADALERPDRLIFDLDPADDVPWKRTVAAARQIRELLEELGLTSFVKTSGGKGLHVVVPLARRHEWPAVADFAKAVAVAVTRAAPDDFIATMTKSARPGKIFVDYLRNQRGATSVAAYSTRARAGAPVAVPIAWDELGRISSGDRFDIASVLRRIKSLDHNPWSEMAEVQQTFTTNMRKQLEG
jgi:bifunctional non-homologous end joining protein LigD